MVAAVADRSASAEFVSAAAIPASSSAASLPSNPSSSSRMLASRRVARTITLTRFSSVTRSASAESGDSAGRSTAASRIIATADSTSSGTSMPLPRRAASISARSVACTGSFAVSSSSAPRNRDTARETIPPGEKRPPPRASTSPASTPNVSIHAVHSFRAPIAAPVSSVPARFCRIPVSSASIEARASISVARCLRSRSNSRSEASRSSLRRCRSSRSVPATAAVSRSCSAPSSVASRSVTAPTTAPASRARCVSSRCVVSAATATSTTIRAVCNVSATVVVAACRSTRSRSRRNSSRVSPRPPSRASTEPTSVAAAS